MRGIRRACGAKPKFNRRRFPAMQTTERKPLFDLGQLVATPGALAALEKSGQSPMDFLMRHVSGGWGEIPAEDRQENQISLEKGFRLMSSYKTQAQDVVWVITEANRSHTTLLLPSEY
jgi:hypothetical protein